MRYLVIIAMLLCLGCSATPPPVKNTDPEQMIRAMTSDENELSMLRTKQRAYPQHQTNEVFLSVMLDSFRTYKRGYQANLIKARHDYPKATEKELAVLANDATIRQMKQDIAREEAAGPPMGMAPQSIHCTSMNMGLFQSTDCY